jgi:16S rRNA (cytidine1402-2'-O)-methyltransferase
MAKLYIIATPIGNLEDLSFRAMRLLGEVDALACEDTRKTRKIFERYTIKSPRIILSYHEHNEQSAGRRIRQLLKEGLDVALCSNAGYPGISDPGYRIINDVWEDRYSVEVIPGPGAVETALVASGLPSSSFTFRGFAPRKKGQRKRFLEEERDRPHTLILFESPHRLTGLLNDALRVLGNRLSAVCIELTKRFEEVTRGFLADLCEQYEGKRLRGEITVVIAGNNRKFIGEQKIDAEGEG